MADVPYFMEREVKKSQFVGLIKVRAFSRADESGWTLESKKRSPFSKTKTISTLPILRTCYKSNSMLSFYHKFLQLPLPSHPFFLNFLNLHIIAVLKMQ
jgi:hypothetical protein